MDLSEARSTARGEGVGMKTEIGAKGGTSARGNFPSHFFLGEGGQGPPPGNKERMQVVRSEAILADCLFVLAV